MRIFIVINVLLSFQASLFVIVSITSSSPISEGKDQFQSVSPTDPKPPLDWTPPLATTDLPPANVKQADPTLKSLERQIIDLITYLDGGADDQTDEKPSTPATVLESASPEEESQQALVDEVKEFLKQAEQEDLTSPKPQDGSWKDSTDEALTSKDLAATSTTVKTEVEGVFSTTATTTSERDIAVIESAQVKSLGTLIDTKLILIIGVTAAVLLVVLLVVVLIYMFRPKPSKNKGLFLNSDFNRWDPQLLRPTQKSIDNFVFGTPIPSISEMIKAQESSESSS